MSLVVFVERVTRSTATVRNPENMTKYIPDLQVC